MDRFTEMQESIITEIGLALNEMTEKNYDKAFIILRNLQDELVQDVNISKDNEKEPSNTVNVNA